MTYDSRPDTYAHIKNVQKFLARYIEEIVWRINRHDESKLEEPEKSMYDEFTPKLRGMTYGSDEYKECLKAMGPALQHHYQYNEHHPEHYESGINGMNLLDILEMLADWKAAGMRHADGSMAQSLEVNRKRFNIDDQLFEVIKNTIEILRW
jgi:hypothetical protein